jgi:hypothetical protein
MRVRGGERENGTRYDISSSRFFLSPTLFLSNYDTLMLIFSLSLFFFHQCWTPFFSFVCRHKYCLVFLSLSFSLSFIVRSVNSMFQGQ